MLFISDVHHGLDSLKLLPKTKEPIVILGDLINWIDYRNGDGIAKDVFGDANLNKLIELRKDHNFDERKNLWQDLFLDDPEGNQQKIEQTKTVGKNKKKLGKHRKQLRQITKK